MPPDPAGVYPRLAVVALVREPVAGRWLLIRPSFAPALWAPVGGRVEAGEGLVAAAVREVREEVGLDVHGVGPCYAALVDHKGEPTLAVSVACDLPEGSPPAAVTAEALAVRWVSAEEWLALAGQERTPWSPADVERGLTLAAALLDLERSPHGEK